ncbi:MAG: ShlB/FhaC/HecB family hemolysin secretion/activation protein [Pseudomonadota bacterium]
MLSSLAVCASAAPAYAQDQKRESLAANSAAKGLPRIAFNEVLAVRSGQTSFRNSGTAPASDAGDDAEQIGAIAITGAEAIGEERFQQVLEGFFGEPLTDEVLDRLTDELTQIAKDEGYPYVRTEVDRRAAAMGIINITIDEGRIDAVQLEGSQNPLAQRILNRLIGKPASKSDLERALLLVSDIPSMRLRGAKLKREDIPGGKQNVLVVRVSERDNDYRIAADNYGSDSFGPVRARASARIMDAFVAGDQISGAVRINPIEPDELVFVSGSYDTQVTEGGARFSVSASVGRTSPGDVSNGADLTGDTRRASARLSVPVKRARKASIWLDGGIGYVTIQQDDTGDLLRDDTIVTASAGLRTQFAVSGGRARTGVTIERGLGILDATRLGDPLASRRDGDGVFTKVRFNADLRVPLAKRVSLLMSAAGQIADRPLLGPEEIALGGAFRTRGYNFAEVLGDEGIYGLAELRYNVDTGDLPLRYLQLYGFIDGGYVSDIDATGTEGTLFSAGPGLRTRLGPLDLELEGGFPLGGSGERTDDPDPQVNLRAGVNF